ncbi:hypothetical protein AM593_07322, partial [Mytilus galloprovincialis]
MKAVAFVLLWALLLCVAVEVAHVYYPRCPYDQLRCNAQCVVDGCLMGYCGGLDYKICKCLPVGCSGN